MSSYWSDTALSFSAPGKKFSALEGVVLAEQSRARPYWLATVRHGLAMIEANLAWVDQAVAELGTAERVAEA
ncbi:hypothetical protein ACFVYC_09105 [Pseudarthrobacter sp. NPDC058329]|uniref:hypothetical protein n=1 Tax=Pseudarthrobacter sp. NPDC058329 TaxID=3346448 RepID=UPI0036DF7F7C